MELLGPLKFHPQYKEKIWGGDKIRTVLHHDFGSMSNCGELWAISGIKGSESEVAEGPLEGNTLNELLEVFMADLVGEKVYEEFENEFPLLIKFIDATEWLSIQVHPDDELAQERDLPRGKTEMWYVLQADEKAALINGFSKSISKEEYQQRLQEKTLQEVLNLVKVKQGDAFYIDAKKVHAIGPGILLTEIQQSADTTYRIYDWDRVDAQGNSRDLHVELALDSINFEAEKTNSISYKKPHNQSSTIVDQQYFSVQILEFDHAIAKDYQDLDSFVIYIVTQGSFILESEQGNMDLGIGDVVLLPAITKKVELHPLPASTLLEVYIK
jgi:mannose-6-phosphate isomerase